MRSFGLAFVFNIAVVVERVAILSSFKFVKLCKGSFLPQGPLKPTGNKVGGFNRHHMPGCKWPQPQPQPGTAML